MTKAEGEATAGESHLFYVDDYPCFRITVTKREGHYIDGTVEEIQVWEGDAEHTPAQFDPYLAFYMKFDGCCHVWFGEEVDGKRDGYLHMCGARTWKKHILLMQYLYKWAAATIPMCEGEREL